MRANRDGTANVVEASRPSRPPAIRRGVVHGRGGAIQSGKAAPGTRARPARDRVRPEQARRRAVVTASALPWTIVRPPTVYGPRDQEVLKVFRIARWGVAPVFGDGSQELSAVHGADLAEALIAAGLSDATVGKTYYACHPEVVTSAGLVRAIGATMGRRVAIVGVPAAHRPRAARPDRGRCTARGSAHDPHHRQGPRVLPGRLDRGPHAARPGHRVAGGTRSHDGTRRHLPLVSERRMALTTSRRPPSRSGRSTICCSAT